MSAESVQGTLKEPLPSGKPKWQSGSIRSWRKSCQSSGRGQRRGFRRAYPDRSFLGHSGHHLLSGLDVPISACCREARSGRAHDSGQIARQGLRRDGHQGHIQGCRRRRGGKIRVAGTGRVPARPEALRQARGASTKRCFACRPARDRKTLLARAVAGEAGVPFFSISGSEFVEMFVGVGAARVRDLFEQARKTAPCIIFIDELDALGRSRTASPVGGLDEKEQTLNQLLAELDGFDPSGGVILLAATNRPEILDPALLRAGRFDRQVLVDRPDRKGRLEILKVHVRKVQLAPNIDLDAVAGLTTGFTGADIANLVNEAAIVATRRNATSVTVNDFTEAIERTVAGLEKKSRVLSSEERRRVAYHEMGHALVAATLPGVDPVHKVSIIPRGVGALGYTIQRPTEDRFLLGRANLKNRIAVLMGGRAAEQLVFDGDVSTGAADDLQRATEIALEMVNSIWYGRESGPTDLCAAADRVAGDGRQAGSGGRSHDPRDRRRGTRPARHSI